MKLIEVTGDLFDTTAEAIGHGINCQGSMGAGIAAEFRRRYPVMYEVYKRRCAEGRVFPGSMFCYKATDKWVFNIASQDRPGPDARLNWLARGLHSALEECDELGVHTLALPRIGAGIGGLAWVDVKAVLQFEATESPVDIEVWTLPELPLGARTNG